MRFKKSPSPSWQAQDQIDPSQNFDATFSQVFSWIITEINYPNLRLGRRVVLFNLSLDHYGLWDPKLFKSWDYLNVNFLNLIEI